MCRITPWFLAWMCVDIYMVNIMITNKERGLVLGVEDGKDEFRLAHTVECLWDIQVNICNKLLHIWV